MKSIGIDKEAGYEIATTHNNDNGNGVIMRLRWNFELDDVWSVSILLSDEQWTKPEMLFNEAQYYRLLNHFGLVEFRQQLSFNAIVRSSPKDLGELKERKEQLKMRLKPAC